MHDGLASRVVTTNQEHKCFIVATCDRDLKRRIRKVPGVPIMYITQHKYSIERLPEATIGGGRLHNDLQDSDMKCNASAVVIFRLYSDNPYAQLFVTVKRSEAHKVAVACEYRSAIYLGIICPTNVTPTSGVVLFLFQRKHLSECMTLTVEIMRSICPKF
ncbi:hypothetical protein QUC31_005223 [Theobroma cacao]